MHQLRQKLQEITEQYYDGVLSYREYIQAVTLAFAESQHTIEVALWISEMIKDKVDHDAIKET